MPPDHSAAQKNNEAAFQVGQFFGEREIKKQAASRLLSFGFDMGFIAHVTDLTLHEIRILNGEPQTPSF